MPKLFLCFSLLAIAICSALSIRIDPSEVKHLVQFLSDFKDNFCEDPIAFCFATSAPIFGTFLSELKAQKNELLKRSGQRHFVLFDKLEELLGESIVLNEPAKQKGRLVCQFAADVLHSFTEEVRIKFTNEQQKELVERRGLNGGDDEKYLILLGVFKECEDSLGDRDTFLKELPSFEFDWTVPPAQGQFGSLRLQQLDNPLEIKLLAQLMVDFAKDLNTKVGKVGEVFKTNLFAFGSFQEALGKIIAENSALIGEGSFVDQLNALAKNSAQHNTGGVDGENDTEFGHVLSTFLADITTDFVHDAHGIFSRSEMGKKLLEKHGLDENALKEYEFLAKAFRENSKELQFGKNITKFGWNVAPGGKGRETQNSLKLKFDLFKRIEFDLFRQIKFDPKQSISMSPSQILQLIETIRANEQKTPNCEAQIGNVFEQFYANRNQNAIFDQLVRVWAQILSISEVSRNEQLEQYLLCNFMYTLGTTIVFHAAEKANAKGRDYAEQLNALALVDYVPASLIKPYMDLAVHYQGIYQDFAKKIAEMIKAQQLTIYGKIKSIYENMKNTELVFDWDDGAFPFPPISQEDMAQQPLLIGL